MAWACETGQGWAYSTACPEHAEAPEWGWYWFVYATFIEGRWYALNPRTRVTDRYRPGLDLPLVEASGLRPESDGDT